jgi:hypothetical protein
MSKMIKKYKENYGNFLGVFKGPFEYAGVQLAKYNTHTQERGVNIAKLQRIGMEMGLKNGSGLETGCTGSQAYIRP